MNVTVKGSENSMKRIAPMRCGIGIEMSLATIFSAAVEAKRNDLDIYTLGANVLEWWESRQ